MSNNDKITAIISGAVKDARIDFINKLSRKKGWTFGDNNPYFDELFNHMGDIKANSLRQYKKILKERQKNEKDRIISYFNKS